MRALLLIGVLAACGGENVSREVGARCTKSADCDERCLAGTRWPGGFCSISCDGDSDCPTDTRCIADEGDRVCAFVCDVDPDCAFLLGDYVCKEHACVGT